ncbi:hypothetical protein MnTg04_00351 [bacterium MnTg04]|nr:hypothetical protein MnTg04_00351 [bacterium MnTg04]
MGRRQPQGTQNFGNLNRLVSFWQNARRAQFANLVQIDFATLRCVHQHRNVASLGVLFYCSQSFKAIHAGQKMVHKNNIGVLLFQVLKRRLARIDRVNFDLLIP